MEPRPIEGNTLYEGQTYNILIHNSTPSNKITDEILEVRNYRILKGYLDSYEYVNGINEKLIKKYTK
jgi:hypothetical protein